MTGSANLKIAIGVAAWLALRSAASLAGEAAAPTFEQDVAPIFAGHCAHCHGGEKQQNGLDLSTRAGVLAGGKTSPAVTPGSLRDSLLWSHVATGKMPADDNKLSADQKDVLRRWIVGGALDVASAESSASPASREEAAATKPGRPAPEIARAIDQHIDAKLASAKIPASPRAQDAEFVRRATLDLTGRIPTYSETVAFLADEQPDKRAQLIDRLLASPAYGEHMAAIWHRLLLPATAESYGRMPHDLFRDWLAERFNRNAGWDEIVTELLTAEGVLPPDKPEQRERDRKDKDDDVQRWNPAVSYMAIHNAEGRIQPRDIAASSSRLFLGQSIECAQCHNHPLAKWQQSDFWATAAFFGRTRSRSFPGIGGEIREFDKMEQRIYNQKGRYYVQPAIHAEPLIAVEDEGGTATATFVRARFLDGREPPLDGTPAFRPTYAAWLTSPDNPYFARAAVNRWWAMMFARGFVEPVDDLAEDNPASHPELLAELSQELSASQFDLKHLLRAIMLSETYQRTSVPLDDNATDMALRSHQSLKQMSGEVLLRSLTIAAPIFGKIDGDRELQKQSGYRSGLRPAFLVAYDEGDGAPPADYTRGLQQALRLMNGDGKLLNTAALAEMLPPDASVEEKIDRIYLTVLSRPPTSGERERMARYVSENPPPPAGTKNTNHNGDPLADVYWVLLNSGEFMFNH